MPLYNGDAFLDAAVRSVKAQTYQDWELFIIDDGSKDGGPDRARRWAESDSRIRFLTHPGGINRGVSATRNLGIQHARGEYCALLDCDDVWLPEKLEQQARVARENPDVLLIYSKAQVIDEEGRPVVEPRRELRRPPVFGTGLPDEPNSDFNGFLEGKFWVPASSALILTAASNACGHFVENLGFQVEDTLLFEFT